MEWSRQEQIFDLNNRVIIVYPGYFEQRDKRKKKQEQTKISREKITGTGFGSKNQTKKLI